MSHHAQSIYTTQRLPKVWIATQMKWQLGSMTSSTLSISWYSPKYQYLRRTNPLILVQDSRGDVLDLGVHERFEFSSCKSSRCWNRVRCTTQHLSKRRNLPFVKKTTSQSNPLATYKNTPEPFCIKVQYDIKSIQGSTQLTSGSDQLPLSLLPLCTSPAFQQSTPPDTY